MIWPQAAKHTCDDGRVHIEKPRSLSLIVAWSWPWRYKDRKFLLWSSHDAAEPIFHNLQISLLLDYRFFRLTFLTIYFFTTSFSKSSSAWSFPLKKKTALPPGENNIYYFNIFEVHTVELLFICLSIICISQSWLFKSSIFSLEISLFEVYVIITHLLSILSMANIFCSLSIILFTMCHRFFLCDKFYQNVSSCFLLLCL